VDTATSALLRDAPVANAFGSSAWKIATSGMPMAASRAWRSTVANSQRSVGVDGCSMIRACVDINAMRLLISSETSAPPMPKISANSSIAALLTSIPCARSHGSIRFITNPNTINTARLVNTNNPTRRIIDHSPRMAEIRK